MATHSSILAWKIPWTEELGRLQPFGSQRVGLSTQNMSEGGQTTLEGKLLLAIQLLDFKYLFNDKKKVKLKLLSRV